LAAIWGLAEINDGLCETLSGGDQNEQRDQYSLGNPFSYGGRINVAPLWSKRVYRAQSQPRDSTVNGTAQEYDDYHHEQSKNQPDKNLGLIDLID